MPGLDVRQVAARRRPLGLPGRPGRPRGARDLRRRVLEGAAGPGRARRRRRVGRRRQLGGHRHHPGRGVRHHGRQRRGRCSRATTSTSCGSSASRSPTPRTRRPSRRRSTRASGLDPDFAVDVITAGRQLRRDLRPHGRPDHRARRSSGASTPSGPTAACCTPRPTADRPVTVLSGGHLTPSAMPDPTATRSRPPLWRDVRVLRVAFQVAVLAAVVGLVAYLYDNLRANDVELDSFDFLDQQAGLPASPTPTSRPVRHGAATAILTGLRNTLTVAVVRDRPHAGLRHAARHRPPVGQLDRAHGPPAPTSRSLRNVPPLLVIIFVNSAALATLPPIDEADEYWAAARVSVAEFGVVVPRADGNGGAYVALLVVAASSPRALVAGGGPGVEERTGAPARRWLWVGRRARRRGRRRATSRSTRPVVLSHPEVEGLSITGGARMGLPFVADARRPRALHVVARGRDRAGIDPGGPAGADRGGGRHRPVVGPAAAPRRAAPGLPHRHPADHQPVPQPHEEHVAGRRRGLRRD